MADEGLSGGDGHTLENGLQREMSLDKELQDRIHEELDTLNTEASRINDLEAGLSVRYRRPLGCKLIYGLNRRVEKNNCC